MDMLEQAEVPKFTLEAGFTLILIIQGVLQGIQRHACLHHAFAAARIQIWLSASWRRIAKDCHEDCRINRVFQLILVLYQYICFQPHTVLAPDLPDLYDFE
jgi:hypothetical protein